MSTKESGRKKFPKPRGWAVGWVFAQETETAPAEQTEEKENGTGKKMREPKSWAARWDSFALSQIGNRRNAQDRDKSEL
jgi:hypothetical protein